MRPTIYALLVAIIAAFVFIIIKYCVSSDIKPVLFMYFSSIVSVITLLLILSLSKKIKKTVLVFKKKFKYFLAIGFLTTIATLTTIYAISFLTPIRPRRPSPPRRG